MTAYKNSALLPSLIGGQESFSLLYFRAFILYSYLYFVQDIPDNTFVLDNVLDNANSDTHVHNHTGISLSST